MTSENNSNASQLSFYLNGKTYHLDTLTVETWIGRHKDDFYDYKKFPVNDFIVALVEAAKEHGRNEIRNQFKKLLLLSW